MSELKATTAQEIVQNEKDCDYMDELFGGVKMPPTQVYLKSEADKVIAELEQNLSEIQSQNMQLEDDVALLRHNNAELKKACDSKDDWCLHTLKETRHQKYKRCLAMAEWCEATALWCYQAANTLPIGFRATLYGKPVMIEPSRLFERSARLNNWVNRWLALAEKFKEAK